MSPDLTLLAKFRNDTIVRCPYRRYYNQLELKGRPAPYMPHTGHAWITARPKGFQRPYYWGNIATMAMRPMF